ncbi:hypothetical protein MRB53_035764 [Persea americana]|uniref:Uncharacterized protein n=1 Tax=Persea americana TaxID=3435 RepID=A0ACC2K5K4_PERAE|nr:hypothetical protein MRB53_035764 [Persea americana]
MVAELNEIPCGWPLGLENMNMRLQVMETLQATSMEQNSYYVHSSSSSPISSSDFDTESTRSFFPGQHHTGQAYWDKTRSAQVEAIQDGRPFNACFADDIDRDLGVVFTYPMSAMMSRSSQFN